MEKLKISYPIVVEGKYDKIKLDSIIDGKIIVTNGFGVFSDKEKKQLFLSLAKKTKIIVATDSDGGGLVIRNYFKSLLPKDRVIHIYIPDVKGKEKRKTAPSKQGLMGVEGMDADLLRSLFLPYCQAEREADDQQEIMKSDFVFLGLSGAENSSVKRRELCKHLQLPSNLTAPAMLDAVNLLFDREEFMKLAEKYLSEGQK